MADTTTRRRAPIFFVALLTLLALVVAACGGSSGDGGSGNGNGSTGSIPSDEGKPQYGGTITYGLEGKTSSFCPPAGQWAISAIMVASAVYDTLTRPTDDPDVYAPYLAKSVEPSADYKTWTITLRPGITFHDGTPVNAAAVARNIEGWKAGLLLGFVFNNVDAVSTLGEEIVIVTMKQPWVAFPAYLWTTGRAAIASPAQLDNSETCGSNMIGSGPFKLDSFDATTGDVKVVKNENYWRKGLPYLDGINFKPQEESSQRIRGLAGSQFDITHSSGGLDLDEVKNTAPSAIISEEPAGRMEVSHTLAEVNKPPLNDLTARQAIAYAIDRDRLNQIANKGTSRLADQVFDTDIMGHLPDLKYPKQNLKKAKQLADEYKAANGGKFEFSIQSTFDQTTRQLFKDVKRQLAQVGITVLLPDPVDQGTIISQAISPENPFNAFGWRNYPGSDPDTVYVWFYGKSVVNFNHIDDPVINAALDEGRQSPDEATRKAAYERFNKQMTDQVYNFWTWYTQWFIASQPNVHGVVGPNLPDENGDEGAVKPVPILAGIHQTVGLWKDK